MSHESTDPGPLAKEGCERCGAPWDPGLPSDAPCPVCSRSGHPARLFSHLRPDDRQSLLAAVGGIGAVICAFMVVVLLEAVSSLPRPPTTEAPVATPAPGSSPATWAGTINKVHVWVTVVPRGHTISTDARQHEPWWRWGNTSTDAYLFAAGSPDRVLLILTFDTRADGSPEARFYLNQMGAKPVDYSLDGTTLTVRTAGGRPTLVMHPDHGEWLVDGQANYDLTLLLYNSIAGVPPAPSPEGDVPDQVIHVGGQHPAIPDWQTQQVLRDPFPNRGYSRFAASLRMVDSPPFKVAAPVFPDFPYFGIGDGKINWFEENPNPLYLDATRPEFHIFSFTGFETGGSYEISSLSRPPRPDFEAPFAFYNFDPTTRHAQLIVRAESYPAGDPFGPAPTSRQRSSFRYSWTGPAVDQWQFSLQVGGSFPYSQQIDIGGIKLWGVPPGELPTWVLSKAWPVVTFVEAVNGYPGSEGIYFYTVQGPGPWPWLTGARDRPPDYLGEPYLLPDVRLSDASGEGLPPSFRGEYIADNTHRIGLYLSPIDNRVHLVDAQGGVWNLGSSLVLREHNLDGGAYVDAWTLERVPRPAAAGDPPRALPGTVEQALYALGRYVIYSGPEGVKIHELADLPANLPLSPPSDVASWRQFNQQTAPYLKQQRDPRNLASWLTALPGKTLTIEGAQVSDVRSTQGGYRFELALQHGFRAHGDAVLPSWQSLQPGRWLVRLDQDITVQSLSASGVVLSLGMIPDQYPQTGEPVQLRIEVTATGLADIPDATLRIRAQHGTSSDDLADETIDVLAGRPARTALIWQPSTSGRWNVEVLLERPGGEILAQASRPVTVSNGPATEERTVLALSAPSRWQVGALALLIVVPVIIWVLLLPILGDRGPREPSPRATLKGD